MITILNKIHFYLLSTCPMISGRHIDNGDINNVNFTFLSRHFLFDVNTPSQCSTFGSYSEREQNSDCLLRQLFSKGFAKTSLKDFISLFNRNICGCSLLKISSNAKYEVLENGWAMCQLNYADIKRFLESSKIVKKLMNDLKVTIFFINFNWSEYYVVDAF